MSDNARLYSDLAASKIQISDLQTNIKQNEEALATCTNDQISLRNTRLIFFVFALLFFLGCLGLGYLLWQSRKQPNA